MYQGQTIFAQVMSYIPRKTLALAIERYQGNKRIRRFSCQDQLRCMVFGHMTARRSLRELEMSLQSLGKRLYHCGIRADFSRNTLADANHSRDFRIFMDTALSMAQATQSLLPVDSDLIKLNLQAYALDSTTIDLCLELFPWAFFRRTKGGIKMHTLLDLNTGIPSFVLLTSAQTNDVHALDSLNFEPGAFYIMDRAYVDFERLSRIHRAGAFFVTRAKKNLVARVLTRATIDSSAGIRSDQTIRLTGPLSRKRYQDVIRRIGFKDPDSGKRLVFLTNNFSLDAGAIALLYKKRWQVELFFKWVKQHLRIKCFYGYSSNAVATQIWIGVLVFVLIHRIKADLQLTHSPNQIFHILELSLTEKIPLFELFSQENTQNQPPDEYNSLTLFDF